MYPQVYHTIKTYSKTVTLNSFKLKTGPKKSQENFLIL